MPDPRLAVLPSLCVTPRADGRVTLTRKFIEGVQEYQRTWQGEVTVYAEVASSPSDSLDNVALTQSELPFVLHLVNFDELASAPGFAECSIVLASASHRQNHLASLCRKIGLRCVYVTEYSLKTRYQIIDAETRNPFLRWRRRSWARRQEARQLDAIARSDGVQCNGTPTFDAYRQINSNSLLNFDTRMTQSALAKRGEDEARLAHCLGEAPLRLLFSGRLIAMKGAGDLIHVARHLRELGVSFALTICGEGELLPSMRSAVEAYGLSGQVRFAGNLDFHDELVPKVKHDTDIFICCHRQGDPSCTYLETMSCGVPIVGYDNEAFAGLIAESGVGWAVPMNRPERIAATVAMLELNRAAIATASYAALKFAEKHTFDLEFDRRVQHLQMLARRPLT